MSPRKARELQAAGEQSITRTGYFFGLGLQLRVLDLFEVSSTFFCYCKRGETSADWQHCPYCGEARQSRLQIQSRFGRGVHREDSKWTLFGYHLALDIDLDRSAEHQLDNPVILVGNWQYLARENTQQVLNYSPDVWKTAQEFSAKLAEPMRAMGLWDPEKFGWHIWYDTLPEKSP